MSDEKQPAPEFLDQPQIVLWPCEQGHAHFMLMRRDRTPAVDFVMTVDEAVNLAAALSMCAEAARQTLANLPGLAGGDAGKCAKPN